MKKYYTKPKYKRLHQNRIKKLLRRKRKAKRRFYIYSNFYRSYISKKKGTKIVYEQNANAKVHVAPKNLCLIENTIECLAFFRLIRDRRWQFKDGKRKYVQITLRNVERFDFASISVLNAIGSELKYHRIGFRGDFPQNISAKNYLIRSGFLESLTDVNGNKFGTYGASKLLQFEKGEKILGHDDNKRLSENIKLIVRHLTGQKRKFLAVKTIILEICGNTIEHSDTEHKQWFMGIEYKEDFVAVTLLDIGKGLVNSIKRNYIEVIRDLISGGLDNLSLIDGAFKKKYGSSTDDINRNQGLPSIRKTFENGEILNLKVLTNDVFLNFQDPSCSIQFQYGQPWFKGTFYQWELTKESVQRVFNQNA